MIETKKIYSDNGQLIEQTAYCDCEPDFTWIEFIIGSLIGLIIFISTV